MMPPDFVGMFEALVLAVKPPCIHFLDYGPQHRVSYSALTIHDVCVKQCLDDCFFLIDVPSKPIAGFADKDL